MSLIYVKHPIDSYNASQEKIIAESNEKDRSFHALMFNYGNAAYRYHNIKPTHEEYLDWLAGLPENIKKNFEELGFEKVKLHYHSGDTQMKFVISGWMNSLKTYSPMKIL
jgi:hypothetical protein